MSVIELRENVSLAPYTTLGVGGQARWFWEATTETGVEQAALFARQNGIPLFVLGGGSNLLVSDAGFPGLVLRVSIPGRTPAETVEDEVDLHAGAGEDWDRLVRFAVEANLAGIECLAGIPGRVGGTPVQNVGAYGQEVADTIAAVRTFDLESMRWADLSPDQCGFAYRRSTFNSTERGRYVVAGVTYRLRRGGAPAVRYADLRRHFRDQLAAGSSPSLLDVYQAVREIRAGKGMLAGQDGPNTRSAGSFFKNPIVPEMTVQHIASALGISEAEVPRWPAGDGCVKLPAAWLVERAGFPRGFVLGPAGISTQHTLALVNRGGANASDLVALRDRVIEAVRSRFGVLLEQEPVLLGF